MKTFKYVIVDDFIPVVFNDLQHKDMLKLGTITSAGYFMRTGDRVTICGEAMSISVRPGKYDAMLLERFYAKGGIDDGGA